MRKGTRRVSPEKMNEILADKASELFSKKGYHETTLQDIANELGITKGGLYYYVSSKETLLFMIHERFITEGLRKLEKVEQDFSDPIERLERLVYAHVSIMHKYRTHIHVFFEELRYLTGENYEKMRTERDSYAAIFMRAVQEGVNQGKFKGSSPQLSVLYVLGALNFMYTWYQPEKGDPDKVSELFSQLTIDALKKEGGVFGEPWQREDAATL